MQQLNPKHTKNCCNQGGSWKHGEAVGDDRNRWKKSKTKINSHSSETLTSSTFLAFLLSIYIRASPLWPALGKTHIHLSLFSCDIKTNKISFRLLKVVIRRENRFDGSRWFELFSATTFLRARFLLSSYFYFFPHISKRFKIVCEYEIDFYFSCSEILSSAWGFSVHSVMGKSRGSRWDSPFRTEFQGSQLWPFPPASCKLWQNT